MNHIWKDILYNGLPTPFKFSNHGRMVSIRNGLVKTIKPHMIRGYIGYTIKVLPGVNYTIKKHRLIAMFFIPNPNNYPCVLHKNDIKTDNRISNLEWGTQSKNTKDAYARGLARTRKGEDSFFCKLTNEVVINIFNEIGTQSKIAKKYNTSVPNVCLIKSGKNWSHLTGKQYIKSRNAFSAAKEG